MKCLERKISQCILPFIFSQKKVFLIFQETELSYIFFKKGFSYTSGKEYSEPRHIQNQKHIQNSGIFGTLTYSELETYSEPEAYSEHCQTSTMKRFPKIAAWRTFQPQPSFLKSLFQKNFLHLGKRNFLALYFSYIFGSNFPSSKNKKTSSEKIYYILRNGTF